MTVCADFRLRVVTPTERHDPKNADALYLCVGDSRLHEISPVVLEVFDQWRGGWKPVPIVRT